MGIYDALVKKFQADGVIAVVTLDDPAKAEHVARAMLAGGVHHIEIMFRHPSAAACIKALKDASTGIAIGAGTVRTVEQARSAMEAGATFLVSPGFNRDVVSWARENKMPCFPGVDSTLGIEQALDAGLEVLKFFPADVSGGANWLKAIAGPYSDVKFIPTGGISSKNMPEFLLLPNVIAIGGSFLVPKDAVQAGDYGKITDACKEARKVVNETRKK